MPNRADDEACRGLGETARASLSHARLCRRSENALFSHVRLATARRISFTEDFELPVFE